VKEIRFGVMLRENRHMYICFIIFAKYAGRSGTKVQKYQKHQYHEEEISKPSEVLKNLIRV